MKAQLIALLRDESGTAAIECGLFATSIAVAMITVVQSLGLKLKTTFMAVQLALN
jgi:Flp pilus assembly pilin Flp